MKRQSSMHNLYQRIGVLLLALALLTLAAMVGWRLFVHEVGGDFRYAPEAARWVLSQRAQGLIEAAVAELDAQGVVDYRVLAVPTQALAGAPAADNFYRRDRGGRAGPLAWISRVLHLSAAGMGPGMPVETLYVSRLLRLARALPVDYRVRLLARGWRYDDAGRRDVAGTYTHVANAHVWWLAQQAPQVIEPVVSIHPYRPDALALLARWAQRGVAAVTWQPLRQNINLADPRTQAFYRALAAHDVALQLPVGTIDTVYERERDHVAPLALRPALQAGVTVMISVNAAGNRQVMRQVVRLLHGPYADQLHVSLTGVLADGALENVLLPLLQHPQLYAHIRYASGYPRSAIDRRIDLAALAAHGFIDPADVAPLREIYALNPLLFVLVTLRTLHLPYTGLQLPAAVFAASPADG